MRNNIAPTPALAFAAQTVSPSGGGGGDKNLYVQKNQKYLNCDIYTYIKKHRMPPSAVLLLVTLASNKITQLSSEFKVSRSLRELSLLPHPAGRIGQLKPLYNLELHERICKDSFIKRKENAFSMKLFYVNVFRKPIKCKWVRRVHTACSSNERSLAKKSS